MLDSTFIIDGVKQELTPGQMFAALLAEGASVQCADCDVQGEIVDESAEPTVINAPSGPELSLLGILNKKDTLSCIPAFPDTFGRLCVASALIDAVRSRGSFKLRDLALTFDASWHCGGLGEAAAFYSLVRSVCDFADALSLQFASVCFNGAGGGEHRLCVGTTLLPPSCTDIPEMYRSLSPQISSEPSCPDTMASDPSSWIVFIPFDTAEPRLGGSCLARSLGGEFDVAPQTGDADYFIDCFEVVRELIEDGIVLAARPVGRGGLLPALEAFCAGRMSLVADVSDLVREDGGNSLLRVLYSEIPGMLVQIRDLDFDYLDAELLLQEVVFYPLGHPSAVRDACPGVSLSSGGKNGIQNILESLIRNAEGED